MIIRMMRALLLGLIVAAPISAHGQERNSIPDSDSSPTAIIGPVTRPPDTSAGRIGQRQTREDAASKTGIQPMARLNNRIANRIQSRLRNRIDESYDPQSNSTLSFEVAEEQMRSQRR